ncbi:unnamed protein product [Parascedosporium putredinis]|uniref:Flavin-containing monooxygenase n=1 Tax=Parascedosporium putredinis TaxID=1442378 RepID=A0A9P1H1J5_9PEZI|nr:unnamed protein product [Parascedosporium putredinis]CAI7995219.1 unnamed protein product [Parascedosporium putredinis]
MATVDVVIPSRQRTVPGSINVPLAQFPATPTKTAPADVSQIAAGVVDSLNKALDARDYQAIANLFVENGYWRDHLALTWDFRTLQTPTNIASFLAEAAKSRDGFRLKKVNVDNSTETRAPVFIPLDGPGETFGIQTFITLETSIGKGRGLARFVEVNGQWKIFTLYTSLRELTGHEEGTYFKRPAGVEHGGKPGRKNWAERRAAAEGFNDGSEPAVVILGAGQAGLTAAARLKALGVEALIIDQNERVGDNWRKRYRQLVLHDPVWYDHMPYLNFPPQWPIFTPKDKLAQFFEAYATLLELNVWTRTELVHTRWDDETGLWTVIVHRRREDGTSEVRTFHPRHVIQATGHSGKKNMPEKAIVVGCCNSGHDIAQDFLEKGYDVTIVQRSTTHVVSSAAITGIGLQGVYSEDAPPVDDADLLIHGLPTAVLKALNVTIAQKEAEFDKELLDGLEKAGFRTDPGPDGAGLIIKYFQRGGGYYIDVGASRLIAEGKIKVKQGQEISEVLPHGLRFADGDELEADEIVFATGYQNMRTQTRLTFGDDIARRVGDVWGFNDEGEMRTIWQKSGHPGFWFHGGNLALCRYYSALLALQIKALEEGISKYEEI